jgi:hypothetical protein
MGGVGP